MSKFMNVMEQFRNDEDGAAMIEYTILLGVIAVAAIVSVGLVGAWVTGRWADLVAALP